MHSHQLNLFDPFPFADHQSWLSWLHHQITKFAKDISWETEVWVADNPDHMIHFDGDRFLGPYQQ